MRPKNNPKENKPVEPGSCVRWSVKTEPALPASKEPASLLGFIIYLGKKKHRKGAGLLMLIYANAAPMLKNDKQGQS